MVLTSAVISNPLLPCIRPDLKGMVKISIVLLLIRKERYPVLTHDSHREQSILAETPSCLRSSLQIDKSSSLCATLSRSVPRATISSINLSMAPGLNYSNMTPADVAEDPPPEQVYAWFGFIMVVSCGGSLLLVLLLISSCLQSNSSSGSRVLLVHLMLIQLFLLGLSYPIQNVTSYRRLMGLPAIFVLRQCQDLFVFNGAAIFAENWVSCMIALNRFVAIEVPLQYARWDSKPARAVMILLPWVIGMGLTVPVRFGLGADIVLSPVNANCFGKSQVS